MAADGESEKGWKRSFGGITSPVVPSASEAVVASGVAKLACRRGGRIDGGADDRVYARRGASVRTSPSTGRRVIRSVPRRTLRRMQREQTESAMLTVVRRVGKSAS